MADYKKAFVLGHPITHSRSPLIHNHWIKAYGLAGSYEAIDIAPGTLAEFLKRVRSGEFVGGNVTVPLKEEAFAAVDCLTQTAKLIGAVNTIYMAGKQLCGDNTDAYGFSANLAAHGLKWQKDHQAMVLGAGGASRAVIKSLINAGINNITVLNRTLARAEALSVSFGNKVSAASLEAFCDFAPSADLIVNTSSLGMSGKDDLTFDFNAAKPSALVTDIVYVPLETNFLKTARLAGLRTVDGLGMLLHQAVPGFERWFGIRPEMTPELRAIIEADLFKVQT